MVDVTGADVNGVDFTVVDVATVVVEPGRRHQVHEDPVDALHRLNAHGVLRERCAGIRCLPHSQWSNFRSSVQPDGCSTLYATMLSFSSASQKPQRPPPVWKYGPWSEILAHAGGEPDVEPPARRPVPPPRLSIDHGAEDEEADEQHGDRGADDHFDVALALGVERHGRSFAPGISAGLEAPGYRDRPRRP